MTRIRMSVPTAYGPDDMGFYDATVKFPITIKFPDFGFLFGSKLSYFLRFTRVVREKYLSTSRN